MRLSVLARGLTRRMIMRFSLLMVFCVAAVLFAGIARAGCSGCRGGYCPLPEAAPSVSVFDTLGGSCVDGQCKVPYPRLVPSCSADEPTPTVAPRRPTVARRCYRRVPRRLGWRLRMWQMRRRCKR